MADHRRVLIIDDDPQIVRYLSVRLKAKGFETLTASSGQDGFAQAVATTPHVVVMDIRMPDIDGLTVLSRLKEDTRTHGIPVTICSASLIDKDNGLDRGAKFFVQKPFESSELLEAVEASLSAETGSMTSVASPNQEHG